ncbi:unnamed protein product [Adineta steineri]|uniref:F-box domain-containing protein n=2 Tax=Adineta steineri TaxID=433720 RepID=A0A819SI78_9BILA|nr:unnamed protein product [Adineta steineri]
MNFTSLPNAIILNLFEYFSLTELFQYFSDLNSRLNKLLYYEFQKFHLDLRSLSKREVNEIYQNYIPSIINQNISIHLSNDYATPHQIQSFISHDDYKLRQFLHLQSISISNLQWNMLEHLLKNLPNLYQLKCDLNVYINGNEWEDIIKKFLPKLNIFQVRMRYTPTNNENKENQLNEIINSYQSNFWINEHQWFIRCHWYSIDAQERFNFIDVFTVPYTFDSFEEHTICLLAKSTVLYDNNYLQCPSVKRLNYRSSSFTDPIRSRLRFNNLEHLSVSLPFSERFFFIVSKFDRLKTLFVYIEENKNLNNIQSQLQLILDQASRLYSLVFSTWARSDSDAPLTGLCSNSVRRLDLIRLNFNGQIYHFGEKECIELSRLPLGIQCEVLIITVKNRKNILHLINNMKNLRSLYVHSIDHYWPKNGSVSSAMDELVQWLYEQLPSTSTVTKSQIDSFGIHIWIR